MNYMMQRYVQHSLPVSDKRLQECRDTAALHLRAFRDVVGRLPTRVFEFGCGQYLGVAILMGMEGCQVLATDIGANAKPEIVEDTLRRLGAPPSLEDAGVAYRAPYSPSVVGDESFDMVMSTSVLEHVPVEQLLPLLTDCRRILKSDGLCSFLVDYQDHWAGFDKSITVHNYMRYSRRAWALFNPALQFQNRLRHSDYEAAFREAGLRPVSVAPRRGELPTIQLAKEFQHYGEDDLRITGAHFVLARA